MSIDITELDLLPETDPLATADLADLGLLPCQGITCWFWTCLNTCKVTEG